MLIAVDSQSLLNALAKGPLLTQEDFEGQLWEAFLLLARRGCTVVLQFFYSHVSFPPRNAAVDEAVTSLLEDPALDHDAPAIWLTDIIRAVHHHLYSRWLDTAQDARTNLCGTAGAACEKWQPGPVRIKPSSLAAGRIPSWNSAHTDSGWESRPLRLPMAWSSTPDRT